jgi:hypothetical protein
MIAHEVALTPLGMLLSHSRFILTWTAAVQPHPARFWHETCTVQMEASYSQ